MDLTSIILAIVALSVAAFHLGRARALSLPGAPGQAKRLHSLPGYYGYYTALWCLLPALALGLLWLLAEPRVVVALLVKGLPEAQRSMSLGEIDLLVNNIRHLASGDVVSGDVDRVLQEAALQYQAYMATSRKLLATLTIGLAMLAGALAWQRIAPQFRARNRVEKIINGLLIAASSIAIFTTIGIVLSVLFEAIRFFHEVPIADFLFGLKWSPQTAIRPDQVGSSGAFGAIPLFAGTLLITAIAMLVAVPVGLMTAIYLAEYSSRRVRAVAKPLLEILAGIPTVVYGFFAALTVAPAIRTAGEAMGMTVSSESALRPGW